MSYGFDFLVSFPGILISILESSRCRICASLAFSLSACHTPKTKGLNQKIRCCFIQEPLDLRVNQAYILPCTDPVKPLKAITAEKQARQNLIQRTFETCTSIAHHNWGVNLYWAKSCQSRVFVDINGINHLVKAFEALHVLICRKSFRHLNLGITSVSSVSSPQPQLGRDISNILPSNHVENTLPTFSHLEFPVFHGHGSCEAT